ncbi:MAG: DUF929 family protein [Thermoplasmata archaeon]
MGNDRNNLIARVLVLLVGAIIIFSILIGSGIIHIGLPSAPSSAAKFSPPSQIPYGSSFVKISTQDYAGSNAVSIYFDSWIGCPIGAANSWVIYGTLSDYGVNLSGHVIYHYSDPDEASVPNLPGILFNSEMRFSTQGVNVQFIPLYIYNETLYGYPYTNTPINQSDLLRAGYQESNSSSSFPSGIAHLIYEYTAVIPTEGSNGKPSAYLGSPPHVNTVMIITGKAGTFMLNGPFYSPSNIKGYTDSYMETNYNSLSYILNSETLFHNQIQSQV